MGFQIEGTIYIIHFSIFPSQNSHLPSHHRYIVWTPKAHFCLPVYGTSNLKQSLVPSWKEYRYRCNGNATHYVVRNDGLHQHLHTRSPKSCSIGIIWFRPLTSVLCHYWQLCRKMKAMLRYK